MIFRGPVKLEVHGCKFGLVGEESRKDYRLLHGKEGAIAAVFCDFQDDFDECTVQRKSFFDCLINRVSVGSVEVLESPDLGVVLGKVLIGIPVTILE